jgi:AraC-like DNA-binding protein
MLHLPNIMIKMRYNFIGFFIFYILILQPLRLSSQSFSRQQVLEHEAHKNYTSNPNESLKIALLLLKGSNTIEEKVRLNILISKIYSVIGDYTNAANYLFEASSNLETNSFFQNAKINIEKTTLLKSVFLFNQSAIYLDESRNNFNELKNQNEINEIKSQILFEELELLIYKQEYKKAKEFIQKRNHISYLQKGIKNKKRYLLLQSKININLGDFNNNIPILDLLTKLINNEDVYFEIQVWIEVAENYFYQQNYQKAIENALKAQKKLLEFNNIYLLETTTKTLVLSYLALNKEQEYKLLNTKLLTLNTEIKKKDEETLNTVYNLINKEYQTNYLKKKRTFTNRLYLSIGLFILFSCVCGLFLYKKYSYKKRLEEIVNYLEVTNKKILSKLDVLSKRNSIPVETERLLLNKLKKFESTSKFTNKDISLAVLAGQFDTNTKYLSEIINKHYHVNFNTYINKLRINFIIEKLKDEPNFCNYKISYLAEISGFASHSSFTTVFKSICGISPITFIDLLKNESDETHLTPIENE